MTTISIGDVITAIGGRAPARKAIIARVEGLPEGMYGAWFYTCGAAAIGAFDGTTLINGTVLAVAANEFTVDGDVTTEFSVGTLLRLRRGLRSSELLDYAEGAVLLEIIETHLEWVTS